MTALDQLGLYFQYVWQGSTTFLMLLFTEVNRKYLWTSSDFCFPFMFPSKYLFLLTLPNTKCAFNNFSPRLGIEVSKQGPSHVCSQPQCFAHWVLSEQCYGTSLGCTLSMNGTLWSEWHRHNLCCSQHHWPSSKWSKEHTHIYQTLSGSYEICNFILLEE